MQQLHYHLNRKPGAFVLSLITMLLLLTTALFAAPDDAIVKGRIIDLDGNPLAGGNVILENTLIGSSTDADGYFNFTIPAKYYKEKTIKLTAHFVGYRKETKKLELNNGENIVEFVLGEDVLNLEAIVVTGLADKTTKEKTPFSLSVLNNDQLEEVPSVSPQSAIQGKVAGAQVVQGSGKPGEGASVLLRGATSIDASSGRSNDRDPLNVSSRSQDPLYIVDGVILAGSPEDLDGLDIESMEIVKGAAAASIYGSRAANGVIQIRTKRGDRLSNDQTRIKFRSEYGQNVLGNELDFSEYHHYLVANDSYVDDNGIQVEKGDWIDTEGNKTSRIERVIDGNIDALAFKDKPYKQIVDHIDQGYQNGEFMSNTVSVSRNMQNTNFLASYTNYTNTGIIKLNDGYERNTFKLNLDHRVRPELQFSLSTQYSRSNTDEVDNNTGLRNPLEELNKTEADINLTERSEDGTTYNYQPNPAQQTDNPLYYLDNTDLKYDRERLLASFDARYYPTSWLDVEANFSIDRLKADNLEYFKKGFQSSYYVGIDQGQITRENGTNSAINAGVMTGVRKTVGDFNLRSKLRYLYERYDYYFMSTQGQGLTVNGIKDLDNVEGQITIQSIETKARAEGIYFVNSIDYKDRYITDFLIRRDGTSLFGEDQRYHNYYRFSAAWRMSEEPFWFAKDYMNEFKLHYSLGTAGSRPNFFAQYETYSVLSGNVSKSNLGNKELKPEFATEHEFGLSSAFLNRISLEMNYSRTSVKEQLLLVPLPAYKGFGFQWQNAGAVESNSFEVTMEGLAYRAGNHSVSFGLTFDRTRSKITELNVPPYKYGFGQSADQFYVKEGEEIGTIYGRKWVKNVDQLPEDYRSYSNQFQVNDDGYLVWVGEGNSWRDGISNNLWNTKGDLDGDGRNDYTWGVPIRYEESDGNDYVRLGRTTPDFNLGFNTTYRWKGFSLYMLWNAQIGGIVYNLNKQWMYTARTHADMDQAGKSDGEKKPVDYYRAFSGGLIPDEHFAEEGTFYKLRELSLAYSFNRRNLQPLFGNLINRVTFKLIGRNLLTFTDYDGYDPEVGIRGQDSGSSVIGRIDDDTTYPHYRTYSFSVDLEF